jgi:prepilin-type N-terminal cleavage/methylation domain-containing protein
MPEPADTFPIQPPAWRARRGFTLLEVMVAMAVLVVLVGGLAGISSVALRLGRDVLEAQAGEAGRDGFERLLRENLTEIPQDSPLAILKGGAADTQTLVLGKAPGMFPVAGMPLVMESVALETRRDRAGRFAIWLLYYAGDLQAAMQDSSVEKEKLVQMPLRGNLAAATWRGYDPVADEWLTEWEETGRRPHYLELIYRFAEDSADQRMVVWIPALQTNPVGEGGQPGGADGQLNPNPPLDGGDAGGINPGGGGRPGDGSGGRGPDGHGGGGKKGGGTIRLR